VSEYVFTPFVSSVTNYSLCVLHAQESIMDFYWHYVSKDTIDESGKNSFLRAISIASQVFNSISEYIQVNHSTLG